MKRVLITGGTGFIGSRLALRCIEEGESVRVLARRNTLAERENAADLTARGIEVIEGSIVEGESVSRACNGGIDTVYHLAAAQHEMNVPDRHFYEVNVVGTRNLLTGAVDAGVERFVHGSTIGVYGAPADGPVSEDTPLQPDNIYGKSKREGEKVVRSFFDRLPIAVARISETYGPGDRRLVKLFKGLARHRFVMIGPGRNLHHLVYIDDLVEGLRLAASRDRAVGATFVLAGPRAISTREMVAAACRALDRPPPRLGLPLWPLMAVAVAMERTLRPLGIQPPLHPRRMNFFIKSFAFHGNEARQRLGYEPAVDFEEGARRTAEWYRSEGFL
jgi:nucleoside-diphosphate-sugar epimerase